MKNYAEHGKKYGQIVVDGVAYALMTDPVRENFMGSTCFIGLGMDQDGRIYNIRWDDFYADHHVTDAGCSVPHCTGLACQDDDYAANWDKPAKITIR